MAPSALVSYRTVSGQSHQGHERVHLHLGLELILQNTIEFLHVMLQERVQ